MTFKPTGFSETIFKDRYALTVEETWEQACLRIAKQMALAESTDKQKHYEETFNSILVNNYFVPGGRIWYNSGRNNPQLLNCFVLTNQLDSKEGWGEIAKQMIVTSMTGGGCGIDFSDVRPRGAKIGDQKGDCPGPVELMRLIDNCAKPVRAGGQRRVALMFSLDADHPDILEFLDAKLTKGELTHANVSIRLKNATKFQKAVQEDSEWELSWKGKYKKTIKAKELWNKIVTNAYNSAEPGLLNWEMIENESNIGYIEELVTTNPCGEIALSSYDCCCLGHLVLPRFIGSNGLEWAKLADTIRSGVRFLDNVLSVNSYPLPEMKEKSHKLRRIGMGTTGLADTLAMLGLKYGSEEGNKFIDKLYKFIAKVAYESSVMLAVEKGAFPACKPEKHIESGFMKRMPHKIRSLVKEHGIRNCAILTQAPTGTVSILSGNCSSGIESMFSAAYERRYWDKDERKVELVFHPLFKQFMEEGKDVSHFIGSHDLNVRDHMEVQAIVQRWVDNAVSKTINMQHDYPVEDMSSLWLEYLPRLKGTTFYRDGTRGYVKEDGTVELPPLTPLTIDEAKRRYKEVHVIDSEQVDDCPGGVCSI